MDDHEIHNYVYLKVIRDFNIHYERTNMGGNEGIHFPKHDPPFQEDPNL
jgi:hypothetical protein